MNKLRTIIVDDEPNARERIRTLLSDNNAIDIVSEAADGQEALALIISENPDLVFLDIQMPYLNGFSVIRSLPKDRSPVVIFVTAYDKFAIEAFEVNAVDYLLKPFDENRFGDSLSRALKRLQDRKTVLSNEQLGKLLEVADAKPAFLQRLAFRESGRIHFIRVDEIDWIESSGNYASIHVGKHSHMLKCTLQILEHQLNPSQFFRSHRSALVNLDCIDRIEKWFQNSHVIILRGGKKVPLSRRRYSSLIAALPIQ